MASCVKLAMKWYLAVLWLGLLCHAQAPNTPPLVVIVPVANMYSGPSLDSDVVSQAIFGSNVSLLETKDAWRKVQTSDQYNGWVQAGNLRAADHISGYATSANSVQVETLFANLYRETDVTRHQPLITVPFETRLEVVATGTGDDAGWMKVKLPDGGLAWLQAGDVSPPSGTLSIPESIALAKRFLGLPYLWAGRSSFGFDCSGFTQMLLRSRGINMPRDADQQAAWSGLEPIERKDLKAGDLLFFGTATDRITHTAMYIGDGQIIQATTNTHPVVQISRLDDEPWTRLLVACRRPK